MTYEKAYTNFDDVGRAVDILYQACEIHRKENFLKWIREHPEYWNYITTIDIKDITKEIALAVSKSLIESNIVELQVVWIYKCRFILTIDGDIADC